MIDNVDCTLGRNNFLDVKFFVPSSERCKRFCQDTEDCRYYWWNPIGNSEAPQYCYLFRQCAPQDEEPEVGDRTLFLCEELNSFSVRSVFGQIRLP